MFAVQPLDFRKMEAQKKMIFLGIFRIIGVLVYLCLYFVKKQIVKKCMFEASLGQLGEGGMVAAILTIVLCKEAFHSRLFIFCILYAVDFLYLISYMQ